MKTQHYIIQIPEPCHEDWNSMTPDPTGRFCGSCCKSVIDFSNKTDEEIRTILLEKKNEKVCGHFRKTQVGRPLQIRLDLNQLPKNMSSTKTFAIAAFIVFGTFLFSCTDLRGQKIKSIEIENAEEVVYTKGKIRRPDPVKNDESLLKGNTIISTTKTECSENKELKIGVGRKIETAVIDTPSADESIHFVAGGISFVLEPDTDLSKTGVLPPQSGDSILIDRPEDEELFMGEIVQRIDTEGTGSSEVDLHSCIDPFNEDTLVDHVNPGYVVQLAEEIPAKVSSDTAQNQNKYPVKLLNELPELDIYPNPSKGEFNIRYNVLKRSDVRLDIFDEKGILIRTLVDIKNQYEGKYTLPINLPDLPDGIYTVSLLIERKRITEKLIIVK